jgi:serine protease AprX
MPYAPNIVFRMRWMIGIALLALAAIVPAALSRSGAELPATGPAPVVAAPMPSLTPALADLAARHPGKRVEVIVQLAAGTQRGAARPLIQKLGGTVTRDLHIINAVVATLPAAGARELAAQPQVRAVSPNGAMKPQAKGDLLSTSFNQSIQAPYLWNTYGGTGRGVGVAVIDTGIAGGMPDFSVSQYNHSSRVVARVVTNPLATTAKDTYGHGTHVAGILAGDGWNRSSTDPLRGKYIGIAPDANLVSVKVSDDAGQASVLDVIYGLQFVVDHKDDYNIRVVNLSLESSSIESYKTDPLDAAVESAWLKGIVVVAAAGNRGSADDAVSHAPSNDPYVISVGAVDDQGSQLDGDDSRPSWSSRGVTQDGFAKPEIHAPGAGIVSDLAPGSVFSGLCPLCIVDGQMIRAGGTSMAAPVVAGAAADVLSAFPTLKPDQVKGLLIRSARMANNRFAEVDVYNALKQAYYGQTPSANQGLTPNAVVDASTGAIDYTRSSWSRSSWSTAGNGLTADFARSSWSCNCSVDDSGAVLGTRSSWSRSSWSTSWDK